MPLVVEDVVIDTGAVRSIIHVDAVETLDINPSLTDQISRMYGLDILRPGGFVVDLRLLEIRQRKQA